VSDKGPKFRRATTHDRDVYVSKATPASGVPTEAFDDPTGQHEGEELARLRARRLTPERIARLETKHDTLALEVARMAGTLDAVHTFAVKADAERERRAAADERALERRRKFTLALISTLGVALAAVIAAFAGLFS
jgi:hypothetical protein